MYRTADSTNSPSTNPATWVVRLPDGSFLPAGGSSTQGLQEAIDFASQNGFALKVHGGGIADINGQDVSIIQCVGPIIFPPLQGAKIDIHATINFAGNGGALAFDVDSLMSTDFNIYGQIVCGAQWSNGVRFKPRNPLPQDPNGPVITSSTVRLASVVMLGGTGVCIDLDASEGGISSNDFLFIEPNEGGTGVKVRAGQNTTFDHNTLNVRDCHGQNTGINAGAASTYAANIFGNVWNAQVDPGGGVGAEIWGRNDDWVLSVTNLEGQPVNGITLNTTAQNNRIHFLRNDATNKVNNASLHINSITGL